jgi:hypothetical protein
MNWFFFKSVIGFLKIEADLKAMVSTTQCFFFFLFYGDQGELSTP